MTRKQTMRLALQDIELDARLQPRERINERLVHDYAERMQDGDEFKPVVVFFDGETRWLADGFHRYYATRENNGTGILADVYAGTFDDALECSVGANATHGLPRTREDTRRAIRSLLQTDKWVQRSDKWIADVVRCSQHTVAAVREELESNLQIANCSELHTKDGRTIPRTNGRRAATVEEETATETEAEVKSEPEPETEAEVETEAEAQPETEAEVETEAEAEAAIDPEPEPEPEPTNIPLADVATGPQAPEGGFLLSEWNELGQAERNAVIAVMHQPTSRTFNEQKGQDNIEWARWSWNPVTGCKHNCIYCYARDIANRFYSQKFEPTLIPERLAIPYSQKVPSVEGPGYRNVFTCSMADLWGRWVPQEWINAVLRAVTDNPQWNFLMLTKFPGRMAEQDWPANAWVGTSVDTQARVAAAEKAFSKVKAGVKWLSCEPMLEPLKFESLAMFDWVVIGGQTRSTQAPEFQPKWEWVEDLLWQARKAGCQVYFKTNLLNRPREYPLDNGS